MASRGERYSVALLSVVLALHPVHAVAHDLYERHDLRECCHDHDCRAAAPGEIVALGDGTYLVAPTGEIFARHAVKPSPDGRYHRCLYDRSNPQSRTFCVLVPAASS